MKSSVWLAVLAGFGCVSTAQADIYKCVDPSSGKVTYTNTRIGESGCTLLSRDLPISTVPAAKSGRRASHAATSSASPSSFPKVDASEQKSRDSDRRQILESELANEERALDTSRKELAAQEAVRNGDEKNYARVQERLKPFQDAVALHERNIAAIRKEIGNLR